RGFFSQYSFYSLKRKISASRGGQCHFRSGAIGEVCNFCQTIGQYGRINSNGNCKIIGSILTLFFYLAIDPPKTRVEEKEHFHKRLQQIDQVVVSLDMSQFMCNNGFQLLGADGKQQTGGKYNYGLDHAIGNRGMNE